MWRRWVSMCDLCWTICVCNNYVYDILIFNVIYIHKIVQGVIRCVKCVTRGSGNEYFDASVRWAQKGACTVVSYGFFMSLCTNVNYVYNALNDLCMIFMNIDSLYIYNVSFDVCKGMVPYQGRGVWLTWVTWHQYPLNYMENHTLWWVLLISCLYYGVFYINYVYNIVLFNFMYMQNLGNALGLNARVSWYMG